MKYLYARSTYQWGAEKLSYYISMLGGIRAIYLLFLLPSTFCIMITLLFFYIPDFDATYYSAYLFHQAQASASKRSERKGQTITRFERFK